MIERTLVLLKPDAVQRAFAGEIISRFERAGLKIVGMKMVWVDENFAKKHYREELAQRRGENVRNLMVGFIKEGPVIAIAIEGVEAVEVVRKMVGATEPKAAAPGTIRGDYAHVCYSYADAKKTVVKNLIHASSDKNDAKLEVELWFTPKELHAYKSVHDVHIF
jgi:nucleoside-diphosphate kinase